MNQLAFRLPTWGGQRRGAGRNPKGESAGVSRLRREQFAARYPVHVTLRTVFAAGYLRGHRLYQARTWLLRDAVVPPLRTWRRLLLLLEHVLPRLHRDVALWT